MGFSMYLFAKISLYEYNKEEKKITIINNLFGLKNTNFDYTVNWIKFNIAYWDKAYHIHSLIINKIIEREIKIYQDEYKEYILYRDELEDIFE